VVFTDAADRRATLAVGGFGAGIWSLASHSGDLAPATSLLAVVSATAVAVAVFGGPVPAGKRLVVGCVLANVFGGIVLGAYGLSGAVGRDPFSDPVVVAVVAAGQTAALVAGAALLGIGATVARR
jgi:hypothetical protein